jgi:hypothetical protein
LAATIPSRDRIRSHKIRQTEGLCTTTGNQEATSFHLKIELLKTKPENIMPSPRSSFHRQISLDQVNHPRRYSTDDEQIQLAYEIDEAVASITAPFKTKFEPSHMRQLALVAHNHMKPAMKEFIGTYSEILQKFRITGTQTTMRAMSMMHTLKAALETGSRGMIPSFFETLESPAVGEYKRQQDLALAAAVSGKPNAMPIMALDQSARFPSDGIEDVESDGDNDDDDYYEDEAYDVAQAIRIPSRSSGTASLGSRASYLSGVKLPDKKKNKMRKRIVKGLQKSLRRLNSSNSNTD